MTLIRRQLIDWEIEPFNLNSAIRQSRFLWVVAAAIYSCSTAPRNLPIEINQRFFFSSQWTKKLLPKIKRKQKYINTTFKPAHVTLSDRYLHENGVD